MINYKQSLSHISGYIVIDIRNGCVAQLVRAIGGDYIKPDGSGVRILSCSQWMAISSVGRASPY